MKYSDFPWSLQPCYWLSSVPPFKSCKHPYRGGRKASLYLPHHLAQSRFRSSSWSRAPSPLLWLLNSFLLLFSLFVLVLIFSFVTFSYSNSFFFVFLLSYFFPVCSACSLPLTFLFPLSLHFVFFVLQLCLLCLKKHKSFLFLLIWLLYC